MCTNEQTIVEELVGIVGMLSNGEGTTLKEITTMFECLHGPVRQDIIQNGLIMAELTGILKCKGRRYKVSVKKDILGKNSNFYSAGCSSWGERKASRNIEAREDASSDSSLSTQADGFMGVDATSGCASDCYCMKEILSGETIWSSGQFSYCSCLDSLESEGSEIDSEAKGGKRKGKKRLIVKLPIFKKKSFIETDKENTTSENLVECEQEINKDDSQVQEQLQTETEDNLHLGQNSMELPAKRSINDIMCEVMKQLPEHNNPNYSEDHVKDVIAVEENESKAPDDIRKEIIEVMGQINFSQSQSSEASETFSNDENRSADRCLAGATTFDLSKIMSKVMEKVNDFDQSESIKASKTSSKKNSGSLIRPLCGTTTQQVMKESSDKDLQRSSSFVQETNNMALGVAGKSNITDARRSVGTQLQDMLPSCSKSIIPTSSQREKRTNQENNNMVGNRRYLTRSRAKINELEESRVQSPSDLSTSSKRAKIS